MSTLCKYYKLVKQVSYDSGQTWTNLDEYMQGDLYESGSTDCGIVVLYRWYIVDESEYECFEGRAHYVEYYQISEDGGVTWRNVEPIQTQLDGAKPIEESLDCFKFYFNNDNPNMSQYWGDCDNSSNLTYAELSDGNTYYNHKIPYIPDYSTSEYDLYVGNCVKLLYGIDLGHIDSSSDAAPAVKGAFYRFYTMKRCILPNTITQIGDRVFDSCNSLESIEIPDSVTSIGIGAFCICENLKHVKLPSGLTEISDYMFTSVVGSGYQRIERSNKISTVGQVGSSSDVELPSSVTSIGNYAFYYNTNLNSVELPNSVTSIGASAFDNCSNLVNIVIPSGVTSIGNGVFKECSSLTSVTLPNSTTSIGGYAFYNCSNLTSINIPSGTTSINEHTFGGCTRLTAITIPNSVTNIGEEAFNYCTSLTSITINGVTNIGRRAFFECTSLTSLTIGDSIVSFDDEVFTHNTSLTSITILAVTPPTIGNFVFNDTNDCPIYVPSASVDVYKAASGWYSYRSRIRAIQ